MGSLLSVFVVCFMGAVLSAKSSSRRNERNYDNITHFPPNPSLLQVKTESGGHETISLKTLIESYCPSLFRKFTPLWYLFNGHLQTLYCVFGNFAKDDPMTYSRRYIQMADGGTIGLDFAPVNQDSLADDTPIVVIQHGLTGGSYEPYVRAILHRACAPVSEGGMGYRAVVINFRGCAGVPVTSPRFYSAGHTDDTRHALAYVSHLYPNAHLHAVGFSLGSNVLTRYLGEEGEDTRLHSTCALACPWNLLHNNRGLLESFLGTHVYSKGMGGNLLNLLKKHAHALMDDPSHHVAVAAQKALALKSPTLELFDETFTRIAGGPEPHFPFNNADDYYVWGSSDKMVEHIRVPFLAINADDDPVVRRVPMDGCGNKNVIMQLTKGGGHLGWFEAGEGRVERWSTKPVLEWLQLMAEKVVQKHNSRCPKLRIDDEGWLQEEGRPRIRFKELVERRCIVEGNRGADMGVLQGL